VLISSRRSVSRGPDGRQPTFYKAGRFQYEGNPPFLVERNWGAPSGWERAEIELWTRSLTRLGEETVLGKLVSRSFKRKISISTWT